MENCLDIGYLRLRILELEEKVEQLRLSRRVLMNLLEREERERNVFFAKLEKERNRLQQNNSRYAKRLLDKNQYIVELESKLGNLDSG